MTEYDFSLSDYILPKDVVKELKEHRLIGNSTPSTEALIRCANCPLAKCEPFYSSRASQCSGFAPGTTVPISHRLAKRGLFELPRQEEGDPSELKRPLRVIFELSDQAKTILNEKTVPLPGCQKREA